MKVAIISSGFLPIPSSKGGAVESLVESLLKKNEVYGDLEIEVFSIFDEESNNMALQYKKTNFCFIKKSKFAVLFDKCIYWCVKNILKKENSHSYRFLLQRLHYLKKVSRELKENDYDKVILENHPTQYLALKWKKNYKKYEGKYFYHCHNEIGKTYKCDDVIRKTENFICISNFIKEHLKNKFDFINDRNISILKNCIDVEKFNQDVDKESIKNKYGIDLNKKIIMYTGRLVEEKGILKLVEALEYINTNQYQLVIVGGVVSKINFETTFTKKLKLECEKYKNNIIFTGYIDHDKINEMYKIADIVVLPSIWQEPAGLTMLEAMASGAALITTNVGGISEYVKEDAAVVLENNENLKINIAKSINELLENETYRLNICKNGYKYAKEYNLDNYYKNFVKILKS